MLGGSSDARPGRSTSSRTAGRSPCRRRPDHGLHTCAAWADVPRQAHVHSRLSVGWDTDVEFRPLLRGALLTLAQMCARRSNAADTRQSQRLPRGVPRALLPPVPEVVGLDIRRAPSPPNNTLGFGGDWYDLFAVGPTQVAVIVGDQATDRSRRSDGPAARSNAPGAHLRRLARRTVRPGRGVAASPSGLRRHGGRGVLDTTTTGVMRSCWSPPSLMYSGGSATLLEAGRRPGARHGRPTTGRGHRPAGAGRCPGGLHRRAPGTSRPRVDDGIAYVADVVAATGAAAVIADAARSGHTRGHRRRRLHRRAPHSITAVRHRRQAPASGAATTEDVVTAGADEATSTISTMMPKMI